MFHYLSQNLGILDLLPLALQIRGSVILGLSIFLCKWVGQLAGWFELPSSPPSGTRPSKMIANWLIALPQFWIGIVQRWLMFRSQSCSFRFQGCR